MFCTFHCFVNPPIHTPMCTHTRTHVLHWLKWPSVLFLFVEVNQFLETDSCCDVTSLHVLKLCRNQPCSLSIYELKWIVAVRRGRTRLRLRRHILRGLQGWITSCMLQWESVSKHQHNMSDCNVNEVRWDIDRKTFRSLSLFMFFTFLAQGKMRGK